MPLTFEDTFRISGVDPDGKKFDRVSRAVGESIVDRTSKIIFDYHSQLFPLKVDEKVKLSLLLEEPNDNSDDSQADYVTNSVVFKVEQTEDSLTVLMSAGGLLTSLKAEPSRLPGITNGQKIVSLFSRVK